MPLKSSTSVLLSGTSVRVGDRGDTINDSALYP